jgi:hypothetical protein
MALSRGSETSTNRPPRRSEACACSSTVGIRREGDCDIDAAKRLDRSNRVGGPRVDHRVGAE